MKLRTAKCPAGPENECNECIVRSGRLAGTLLIGFVLIAIATPMSPALGAVGPNWIEQFGITWTFDKNLSTDGAGDTYQYGTFVNGDYWVVGPVTIIGINPPSVSGGREMHGAMINTIPGWRAPQGWDSSINYYDSSLNVALDVGINDNSLELSPGSSLVSAISLESGYDPLLRTAAVLTVLNSAPPDGSFRPAYAGTDKTIKFNKNQLNYSLLQSLTPVPSAPSLQAVERYVERPWIDHQKGWSGKVILPAENMSNYGRDISGQVSEAALMLHLDFTNQEKETLLIRLVQVGIDLYGLVQNGLEWPSDGGHASGRKWPILFAGIMLDDNNMKNIGQVSGDYLDYGDYGPGNPPPDYVSFGEDDQTFFVAAENIGTMVPYNNPTHYYGNDTTTSTDEQYISGDELLPEWGIRHATTLQYDRKNWNANYRSMHNVHNWGGFLLAAHMMEEAASAKTLWNHDALFDYMDRDASIYSGDPRYFSVAMWAAYRNQYGCIWTRDSQTDIWSNGTNPCDSDDTTPPLPPSNLVNTSRTESSINLSWTVPGAASDGDFASSYRVFRAGTQVGTATQTSYQDTGLVAETSYAYQVYSIDDAGNLSSSAAIGTFTTSELPNPVSGIFYISSNGDNGNTGNDWNSAWRQLPAVLERGATYYIADGDYSAYIFDDTASGTEYITIKKATLAEHGTETGWQSFYTNQAVFGSINFNTSYVIFDGQVEDGIKIERRVGPGGAPVEIGSSDHITLRNCDIDGMFQTLVGDEPSGHTNGACIVVHMNGASYITFENCKVHDAADDGFEIHGADHLSIKNNEIYNLYGVSGSCQGHSDGIEAYNVKDSEFIGNLIYDIRSTSAFFFGNWAGSPSQYCENITLANNIFYSPETGFAAYIEDVDNIEIYNNVFWGRAGGAYGGLSIGQNVTNMDMYNNIILSINYTHVGGTYDPVNHRGNYNLFGVSLGQYPENTYDIVYSNPQFENIPDVGGPAIRDVTVEDFRLTSTSPCVDAGTTIGFDNDISGTLRPQGTAYDIGAYEFVPLGNQAPIANAGPDQTIIDSDGNGSEQITLDGFGSTDSDSTIQSYVWTESGNQIATGVNPTITLSVTVHTITLTVTDNNGLADTDTVDITVEEPDVTNPQIVSANASETSVEITFSEALNTTSAEQTSNYSINNGIFITAASLDTDTVTLTTSAHTEGTYILTVVNVQDTSGNPMPEATTNYQYNAGLIAFWEFNDPADPGRDSSGNGNNATLINGAEWTNGNMHFSNDEDAVQVPTTGWNVNGGTVLLQVYPEDLTEGYIFGHTIGSWSNRIQLYIESGNLNLGLGGSHRTRMGIQTLAPQTWVHVALTWDGSAYNVYIDGIERASGSYTGLTTLNTIADIGNTGNTSARTESFNGLIDEVRVYNRALSADEIQELYSAGTEPTNQPPTAVDDDNATVNEDTGANTIDVLANDTDADGDTLTITSITQASHGSVTITGSGTSLTYTPTPDYNGPDSFTYTISDGQGGIDTATVSVTVTNIPDAPVLGAIGDITINENQTLTIVINATDADGDTITYSAQQLPPGATFASPFVWTPTYDDEGTYEVIFIASDGSLSDSETITITVNNVNRPPVAADDSAVTDEDTTVTTGNVLTNDTDGDGDTITIANFTQPGNGTTVYHDDGTFTYTPTLNYYGSDSFTYTISDGQGGIDTATVSVTVTNIPDAPVLGAIGDITINENQTLTIVINATDADGDTITYSAQQLPPGATFASPFVWTPTYDDEGTYEVIFIASDGFLSDSETITITVNNFNQPPVAVADSAVTDEDTIVTTSNVLVNDTDGDGDTLTVAAFTQPSNGTTVYNGDGTFTYTPAANYNGNDSFTYTVSDGNGGADTATVQFDITAINDSPDVSAIPDVLEKYENESILPAEIELATDVDSGDTLTYTYVPDLQATDYILHVDVSDGTVTVGKDITITVIPVLPTVISATATKFTVEVVFSEDLEQVSAENIDNYSLSNGITVNSLSLNAGLDEVTLYTTGHAEDLPYTLTVANVEDLAGNPMIEETIDYTFDDGLIGLWRFNDKAGDTAQDSSGYGNTATLVNGPVWSEQSDLNFDGIDDAVEIPTANWNVNSGTIALWAYAKDLSGIRYLFGHTTGSGNNKIGLYTDEGNLNLGLGDSDLISGNTENLDLQTWYHFTLTWDGTNYVLYVNGSEEAWGTFSGLTDLNTFADIGNTGQISYRNDAFDGYIDDARVYKRALSPDEVVNVYLMSDEPIRENKALAFEVSAIYADGTALIYSDSDPNLLLDDALDGASFEDGTFTWNPWYDQAGTYDITFLPDDQQQPEYSQTVTVVVEDVELSGWYQTWLEHLGLL